MSESSSAAARTAQGRFVPGRSGNPAGKPRGRRNDATLLREGLSGEEIDGAVRVVADKLAAGNLTAARFVIDRLNPRPRGRPVELPSTGGPVRARCQAVFAATAAGEITPGEAAEVARLIEVERKVAADQPAAKPAEPRVDPMTESLNQTEARMRAHFARDAALRAEVATALRAQLEPIIRADVIAAMRAELGASIRTGLDPALLAALREAPAAPAGSLDPACMSREAPASL